MSSILGLTSQGVVFATAMVVSSTVLFLAFSKQKNFPELFKNHDSQSPIQNLRSCLRSSEEGKKRDKKKKKKKSVKFAENVKDTKGNGDEYRREKEKSLFANQEKEKSITRICRNEIPGTHGMPANRIALYNGILRDRVHRIECSY
ncbi:hypothetical protein P3X46_001273 [Hevea brasiliensis]|uniref:Uncharacterized protein n=1 Tax=Hevea brasiliensis TaxID=3981 RepID=A0ABQ9NC61_HEVBR|nr:uncharacterized protein LOC110650292 [Hevea brasiliensis]KAJ9190037.1 hypothetical protein P3X46_001273 [Hevea brasiliensis]